MQSSPWLLLCSYLVGRRQAKQDKLADSIGVTHNVRQVIHVCYCDCPAPCIIQIIVYLPTFIFSPYTVVLILVLVLAGGRATLCTPTSTSVR